MTHLERRGWLKRNNLRIIWRPRFNHPHMIFIVWKQHRLCLCMSPPPSYHLHHFHDHIQPMVRFLRSWVLKLILPEHESTKPYISPISFSSRSGLDPKSLSLSLSLRHSILTSGSCECSLRDDIVGWIRRWNYTSQNITHQILNNSHWVSTAFPLFDHNHRDRYWFMIRSILLTLIITPNRQWDTGSCLTQEMDLNQVKPHHECH